MHLWHDVPRGDNIPDEFNCIIEIPRRSLNKYEIDKNTGMIILDRANYTTTPYPFDYGYIPQTLWDDGDALDVIVLATYPLQTGIMMRVRPVAVMEMIDSGESDWKVIAVPLNDKRWNDVENVDDLYKHKLAEYKYFFETYKDLKEDKKIVVEILGYHDRDAALNCITKAAKMYDDKFGT